MMDCLEKIHLSFVCAVLPEVKQAAAFIEGLAQEVRRRGRPCVYLMNTPEEDEGQVFPFTLNASWVPVDVAKFIIQLPAPDVLSQGSKITINMKPSD
jgi:hypothetical protein